MPQIVVVTPPELPPVSLDEAKQQCRATGYTTDDELIYRLLLTATGWVDGPQSWLGRCLTPQVLELRQETFSAWGRCGRLGGWDVSEGGSRHALEDWSPIIRLPCGPVQSIVSVTFIDVTGTLLIIDPSLYELNGDELSPAWGQVWPTPRGDRAGVRIRYAAGYPLGEGGSGGVPTTPQPIRHAILMLVSHWYRNPDAVVGVEGRDSSTPIPLGLDSLLGSYQRFV